MGKFTKQERETLKELVFDGMVRRLSNNEIQIFIKSKLGVSISIKQITRIKNVIKSDSYKWIAALATGRDNYIAEYRNRIEELKANQRELWTIHYQSPEDRDTQIKCQLALAKITMMLASLYDALPIVHALSSQLSPPSPSPEALVEASRRINGPPSLSRGALFFQESKNKIKRDDGDKNNNISRHGQESLSSSSDDQDGEDLSY